MIHVWQAVYKKDSPLPRVPVAMFSQLADAITWVENQEGGGDKYGYYVLTITWKEVPPP